MAAADRDPVTEPPFSSAPEELLHLLELLAAEKEAEREEFRREWLSLPLARRKEIGITLHPVEVEDTRISLGDRWRLRLRLPPASGEERDAVRRFQSGQVVELFRGGDDGASKDAAGESQRLGGVIAETRPDTVTIMAEELPGWAESGTGGLGLDLTFNETTYREMEFAVRSLVEPDHKGPGKNSRRIRDRLLGYSRPQALTVTDVHRKFAEKCEDLNESQREAVAGVLALMQNTAEFAVIHGPPGTGKTTTVTAAIATVADYGRQHENTQSLKILAAAPTNAAVDLLVEKLSAAGLNVLRLGHPARVSENLWRHTLEGRSEEHPEMKTVIALRREAEKIHREARRYRRNFGAAEAAERRSLYQEYRELQKQIRGIEDGIVAHIIDRATVILTTLVGASNVRLRGLRFDLAVIDEASQALEPAAWIAVRKADRVVFAGDHHQLPPVVKSSPLMLESSTGTGTPELSETLFEKTVRRHPESGRIFFLNTQYRMEPEIVAFSNREFYGDRLQTASVVQQREPATILDELGYAAPLVFVDTAGADCVEEQNPETLSYKNEGEARLLLTLLENIEGAATNAGEQLSTGVIAAYRDQARHLRHVLRERYGEDVFGRADGALMIEADTVDSFQGRERDVILISLVRSNDDGETGFLGEVRRMNVALTRARRLLVVVGDSATLCYHSFYERFLEFVQKNGEYRSAYEYLE